MVGVGLSTSLVGVRRPRQPSEAVCHLRRHWSKRRRSTGRRRGSRDGRIATEASHRPVRGYPLPPRILLLEALAAPICLTADFPPLSPIGKDGEVDQRIGVGEGIDDGNVDHPVDPLAVHPRLDVNPPRGGGSVVGRWRSVLGVLRRLVRRPFLREAAWHDGSGIGEEDEDEEEESERVRMKNA